MIERFETLLADGKETALVRFTLGNEYLKLSQHAKAIEHLQRAVALDAQYSAAWKLLGKSFAGAGRNSEAISAYELGIAAATARGDKQAAKEMSVFRRRLMPTPAAAASSDS